VITFTKLTFQNLLSVGNAPVTINLNESKTTLIHGTNGSGKSLILDALCYSLFGKPFRRINLPQLINTQNKKGLLTEVEFSVGRNNFVVTRGMKPKVFTITKNGEELDAKAADKDNQAHLEQNILKLTMKSFLQVVVLGSASYTPFMQLNSAGRRECVEDFLDIKVFSTMSLLAKERLRGVKDQVRVIDGDIGNLQFKIDVQKDRCDEIQRKAQESTQEYKDELKQISEEISNTRKTISRLEQHQQNVLALREKLAESKPAEKVSEVQKVIAKLEQKSDRLQKEIDFYADKDDCPTCLQKIALETKNANIQRNTGTIKTNCLHIVEGQKVVDKMSVKLRILRNRDRHLESLRNSLTKYSTELFNLEDRGRKLVDKIKELENDTGDYSKESGKLEVFIDDLNNLDERKDYLVQDVHDLEVVTGLLKDSGIKTQIVRKYLPVMNNCIRRNLNELELPIHFVLDEEFNESVSSPLHQNFSYSSFSEGQKARIDLALMFTWREIGKIKNSVSTNLLILDEVFSSSLDDVGKENLLRILRYVLDDSQRVVVVDHTLSEGFKDKFDRSIQVSRVNGFSKYS
jgi:DNA repair exonuclease SbcCD ATPase subunit